MRTANERWRYNATSHIGWCIHKMIPEYYYGVNEFMQETQTISQLG